MNMSPSKNYSVLTLLLSVMLFMGSFKSFAGPIEECSSLLSPIDQVTKSRIENSLNKVFKKDFNNPLRIVDHLLVEYIYKRAINLSPKLREKYLNSLDKIHWYATKELVGPEAHYLGYYDSDDRAIFLSEESQGKISSRVTLVHELSHLEQDLTSLRRIKLALTYNQVFKEERRARAAELEFLTDLFERNKNLRHLFVKQFLAIKVPVSTYLNEGLMDSYFEANRARNRLFGARLVNLWVSGWLVVATGVGCFLL
jgi:hypothetical protein